MMNNLFLPTFTVLESKCALISCCAVDENSREQYPNGAMFAFSVKISATDFYLKLDNNQCGCREQDTGVLPGVEGRDDRD